MIFFEGCPHIKMWLSSNSNRHLQPTVCLASCTHDIVSPQLSIRCPEEIFLKNRVPCAHFSRGPNLDPNDNRQIPGNIWVKLG